jgi:lipoate-protein ligase B
MYPILRLAGHAAGPKRFVWLLEEVIIRVLHRWGVEGRRMDKKPGVWTGDAEPAKLASIGIRVERGVTLHGCALNVEMDLAPFALIQPCGMADIRVTSMAALLQRPLPLQDIKQHVATVFREVFSIAWPIALADRLDSSTFLDSRPHA